MPRHNQYTKHQPFVLHKSCDSKRSYKNEIEAQKIAELQMLENINLELSVYKCDSCKFWHLTKTNTNNHKY
jgi:hypothetical protein